MNKIGHLVLGTLLGLFFISMTRFSFNWFSDFSLRGVCLIVVIFYVYSLFADLDLKNSTITWTFIPIGLVAAIVSYVQTNSMFLVGGLILIAVTYLAAEFLPHRGFTHSIVFGILVSLPWFWVSYQLAFLAFVCFYSHLVADESWGKLV